MRAPLRMWRALNQPVLLYTTSSENLDEFMVYTFPGQASMRKESVWRFWNLILNVAMESVNMPDE